jgi:hypothetical protein
MFVYCSQADFRQLDSAAWPGAMNTDSPMRRRSLLHPLKKEGVDGRDKPGHDVLCEKRGHTIVILGLVPRIHLSVAPGHDQAEREMDPRHKAEGDGWWEVPTVCGGCR